VEPPVISQTQQFPQQFKSRTKRILKDIYIAVTRQISRKKSPDHCQSHSHTLEEKETDRDKKKKKKEERARETENDSRSTISFHVPP
jgi:hypothetical protein